MESGFHMKFREFLNEKTYITDINSFLDDIGAPKTNLSKFDISGKVTHVSKLNYDGSLVSSLKSKNYTKSNLDVYLKMSIISKTIVPTAKVKLELFYGMKREIIEKNYKKTSSGSWVQV